MQRGWTLCAQTSVAPHGGMNLLGEAGPLRHLTGMPTTKPPRLTSSADRNAAIERVEADVLMLFVDDVPRSKDAIIAALVARHRRNDIKG
jgi:hypothetical protein